ncbi:hypothetical protein [Citrobacter freundii]|uniref:hypothetical protein n=1 Tax=Citrobacter freundii TaxID=546 RepID=UPI0019027420|nr:hypothetical protein [Citrobacter freundii]MBJ9311338.1 hypothetical protein [Citrobacter freundii]HEI8940829.1 hypothetical protein [Citrobacter freundii]HEJ0167490.1 hypothetical protein [Citrobacter freundii]
MTQQFKIFFIDDELNSSDETQANVRVDLVNQLNKDTRFNIIPYHPVDFINQSTEAEIKTSPDLIIIDYKLSGGSNTQSERYHGTGYSMTSYCKERFADVPCYLVSQLIDDDVSVSEHYDKKLSHGFLTKQIGRDTLASDCNAYRILKNYLTQYKNGQLIISALNVPAEEENNLKIAIPSEFWNELALNEPQKIADRESILIKFTKWINSTFLIKRGPLINSLELATLLGVTQDYFENGHIKNTPLKELFIEKRYTGIFHESFPEKWWAQQCYNVAIDILEGDGGAEPWKSIPTKMNIPQEHWSICPVCNKHYPETVATDKDSGQDFPCHWACSTAGEFSDDIVGFEPQLYLDIE